MNIKDFSPFTFHFLRNGLIALSPYSLIAFIGGNAFAYFTLRFIISDFANIRKQAKKNPLAFVKRVQSFYKSFLNLVAARTSAASLRFQSVSFVCVFPRYIDICSAHVSVSRQKLIEFTAIFSRQTTKVKLFDDCSRS